MKILFVLPQIYPFYTGGAEIFHYHLLKELSRDDNVSYIGYDDICEPKVKFEKILRIKPWRLFTPLQITFKLIKLRRKYDIIHLNYCYGSWVHWFFYPILKKTFKISYGLTVHDGPLTEWRRPAIFRSVFNGAKFVVAVSERLKDDFEERCNREIVHLPPLIPLAQSHDEKSFLLNKYGFGKNDKVLLFVGTLKELKRPLVLINAINIIDREWLDKHSIKVIIAGSGDQENEVKNSIQEYRLGKFIKMVGRVPQEKVNVYYKMASYYVIPSIHEGKSMSLIEGMFNHVPIIASNAPGINDIIFDNKNGLLFELDNPNHLANQIINMVSNNKLAEQFAEQAYQDYLSKFQLEEMLNRYLELYRK